ncbi:ABC transporter permease subunit [Paenisporosarcina quisquiliarum]|uniref:ABC transporter permease subunit n=1 Tax=Paenisporosarcina quisquiliarum TaxID=365346 RepID=A0A9X3LI02_9BACL|nr:ABC transporter permease subunit [Paenisporosarcina quisquiliarum]MCZ8538092.1 ABC transporter permease subunit [Paenisporosarcina quisquiliarum]
MKRILLWSIQFLAAFFSILLLSGAPVLITGFQQGKLLWNEYIETIKLHVTSLMNLRELSVDYYVGRGEMRQVPVFPQLLENITYSLQLLFLALVTAVVFALIGTFITMLLREKARARVKLFFYFLESLPDILIILLAQLFVVIIFQQTGILVSKIAVIGDDRIYWLPVLCLMILPMIQLYRLSMLTFEAEERTMYVELAKSLGFGKAFILFMHIFRNAIVSVFFQSKKTMWFMLSNLFILELMFNIPGVMLYMFENLSGTLFLVTIMSFFLPIFILYSLGEWYFIHRLKRGGVVG